MWTKMAQLISIRIERGQVPPGQNFNWVCRGMEHIKVLTWLCNGMECLEIRSMTVHCTTSTSLVQMITRHTGMVYNPGLRKIRAICHELELLLPGVRMMHYKTIRFRKQTDGWKADHMFVLRSLKSATHLVNPSYRVLDLIRRGFT